MAGKKKTLYSRWINGDVFNGLTVLTNIKLLTANKNVLVEHLDLVLSDIVNVFELHIINNINSIYKEIGEYEECEKTTN